MDLHTAIQETQCALNLVLNNKFSEALDLLKPCTILVMQATMTFEHRDIQTAMSTIKDALQTCQRFRKRNSVVGSLSSLISKQSNLQEESHADLRSGRKHAQLHKRRTQDSDQLPDLQGMSELSERRSGRSVGRLQQFEGGVKLGIGSFNLMLSLLPQRILRLLEFIGFSGNRVSRSPPSVTAYLQELERENLLEAESLLEPYQQKYPKGSIILFYSARISALRGNFEKVIYRAGDVRGVHQQPAGVEADPPSVLLELMWTHSYQQEWQQAYLYADLLCQESRWSKAIYVYQKAAILSMLTEEEQVEGLKQRLAGKSIPTEKFAVRKSRRYKAASPIPWSSPHWYANEMMYVWNGFTIVGKRADSTEALLREPYRYDHYLIPFTLYERGCFTNSRETSPRPPPTSKNAKTNYKDYSMESRLHFRIHAALSSLKGPNDPLKAQRPLKPPQWTSFLGPAECLEKKFTRDLVPCERGSSLWTEQQKVPLYCQVMAASCLTEKNRHVPLLEKIAEEALSLPPNDKNPEDGQELMVLAARRGTWRPLTWSARSTETTSVQ
ncbi:hypothetical protein KUCAC02_035766 [Chaenocephalus aceratus]|nr:hypothetical protein KUCAC02_035766 [Chaenocephalus aceratus]